MTLVVLAILAASLWYLDSPALVTIVEAESGPNAGITALLDSCGAELSASVYEDDSTVVIEVLDNRFRLRSGGGDCQDVLFIALSVPLGNRMLIDDSTGSQIPVSP